MAEQLSTVLNEELWKELQKKRGNRGFCDNLATLAMKIDRAADAPKRLASWLATSMGHWFKRPPLERKIAKKIAEKVADKVAHAFWPKVKLKSTAQALRICGIWVCVEGNLDLRGCECFKGIAVEHTNDYIRTQLEAKLDDIK